MSDYVPQPPPQPPTKAPSALKAVPMWIWATVGVLIVALVVMFTLVFSGGDDNKDSESTPTPAPTVTVTEKPEESKPAPTREAGPTLEATIPSNIQTKEGFSNFIRDMFPVLEGYPDKEITDRAERACNMFDEGATFIEVIEDTVATAKNGDEAEAFGGIAGAAIPVLCPEHTEKIEPYL